MKSVYRTLFLMLAAAFAPVHATHEVVAGKGAAHSEMRDAVEANLTARMAQVQREDAMAGRHLNPAERMELRQQLRRQWAESASASPPRTAESQSAERSIPAPTATPIADAQPARALPGTLRGQRP